MTNTYDNNASAMEFIGSAGGDVLKDSVGALPNFNVNKLYNLYLD
jgi:hypothetical protein